MDARGGLRQISVHEAALALGCVFYLDEDISRRVAEIGRSRGLDIISSIESGMNGKNEQEQLTFASVQGRCFLTCNGGDFMRLSVRFIELGLSHNGILILTPQPAARAFSSVVETLAKFANDHPEGLTTYATTFLRIPSRSSL